MVIQQGDVFWVDLGEARGRGLAYRHPYVVVQGNGYNHSKIGTTVVCGITSNLKRAQYPANVRLEKNEANLPKESVINISQLHTVDKEFLQDKIGSLSRERIQEIIKGIRILLDADN